MRCYKKCLLLAALVVASLSAAASALAATATVTGGPNISGTATTSTLFKSRTAGKTYSCTGSTLTGTVAASTSGFLPIRIGTVTPGFTGCTIVGGLGTTTICQNTGWHITGNTVAGVTPGAVTGISCHVFATSLTTCRHYIVGSVGQKYSNATHSFTIDYHHQNLAAVNSTDGMGGACSVLPNDASIRWSTAVDADIVYSVSPTNLNVSVS
jgi:hypothetical protein